MLRVNGGPAGSGTVIKRERGGPWLHLCVEYPTTHAPGGATVELAGYWASCPDCGTRRP